MKLYGYFRSSAAYRVRIALALKDLPHETVFVHLTRDGGEQKQPSYRAVNPQALVPTLEHDGHAIGQSLAIIAYLDEIKPEPAFLPREAAARARVRQIAYAIACDIHPLNNLRVLGALRSRFGADDAAVNDWYRHWIAEGFTAIESLLANGRDTGTFCHGETPTLADICLIPQVANARRFEVDLAAFPTIVRIDAAARALPAFKAAAPENQPDAA